MIFYHALIKCACFVYLLHFVFVALLESLDLTSSLLGLLDFLPGLHLFLLQQSYTIRQQLSILLDPIYLR